ncbi:hypothetical protein [Prochlorococcus marinus]|uniref:Uncharacterized protein n=1 Tax=Prochlorococcus marinus XMU1408 TaxID=2213228 RepID=A0A318R7J3_PROMR|nr:hypothetical protein [Prochlorococcus marinus]MBW3041086.1 hypothetical protein [Prochlorococcus marinus str. XMU1408]PYE03690.1 hypothetical protein DNJ73_00435 [Prochlorococcus marinus XMU1408]
MTTDLPNIPSSKPKKRQKIDSSFTKWTIFSLCFISTLVVVSLIKSYLPLLVSALAMLFVWSQMTKPVAEIETKATNDNSNQLNLFHRQYKIGRKYSKVKKVLKEGEDRRVA